MSELKVESIKPAFGNKVTVSPAILVTDSENISKFEVTTGGTIAVLAPLFVGTSVSNSAGTVGQVLTSQGVANPPVWTSLLTPTKELPTGGTVGQVLTNQTPNSPTWTTPSTYAVLPQSTSASGGGSVGQQFAWHKGIGNYNVVFSGGCYDIILPAGSKWNFLSWHQTPYRVTGGAHGYLFQQYMSDSRSGTFVASGSQPVSFYVFSGAEQNWGFITRIS
jgi:hypothetical protein